jgi:dephospho-CoA kinase
MIIGITGGIGSGKTTLSELLRSHGYPVYDTDKEAKKLQDEDIDLVSQTKLLLGDEIYKTGKLDRITAATLVFQKPELLQQLMAIVHPVVKKDFLKWSASFDVNGLVFIESAVLFEGRFNELTDKIILVTASETIRIERVMKRDGLTREQVIARIKNQIPDAEKALKSDLTIQTDQGLPDDILQLIHIWQH